MNQEIAVTEILAEYYRAFSTLEIQSILPYFNEPALFIGAPGVFPVPDHAALTTIINALIEDLRGKGYTRSQFDLREFKPMGLTSALASGVALRYRADGRELERIGISYLLHKTDNTWKIAVMVLHGPETA